jgi:hypothetical protein
MINVITDSHLITCRLTRLCGESMATALAASSLIRPLTLDTGCSFHLTESGAVFLLPPHHRHHVASSSSSFPPLLQIPSSGISPNMDHTRAVRSQGKTKINCNRPTNC